jgi:light-regulated signal transduction histidine kinase (bacteriophytochrome)
VQTEQGRLALGLVSDITERKRAVNEIGRVNAELLQSNAELEQFAWVVSHDLKQPLRIIASYLELLSRRHGSDLDAEASEFIRFAIEGSTQMRSLIDDLLNFATLSRAALNLQRANAETAVQAAAASQEVAILESGTQIACAPLPELLADMKLLAQVFRNLIENAIKFRSTDPPMIRITAEKTAEACEFSVQDNGIGIEPEQHSRVFGIFERLHCADEFPGNGIGLTIAQRIVERHGCRIWVESKIGEGSTFHFLIPNSIPALLD